MFFLFPLSLLGQLENSIWYFGAEAGIQFKDGEVKALTDGKLRSTEGCATISDSLGNLLFYTNGIDVWNKRHQIMNNGSDLKGNSSSTQSAIIVKKPGSDSLYFLITVNGISGNSSYGAFYSIVDMSIDNGNGDIISTQKNIPIQSTTDEKITAVLHENGEDIWVLIPNSGSHVINTYLITEAGIDLNPVTYNNKIKAEYSVGHIRISPNGKRIAMVVCYPEKISYLLWGDFNTQNGTITNTDTLNLVYTYGVEFSPNSRYLYVSYMRAPLSLIQLDLEAGNRTEIRKTIFDLIPNSKHPVGCLYLGIDGKIYFANPGKKTIGCIQKPDLQAENSSVVINALDLNGKISSHGLQNCAYSNKKPYISFIKKYSNCLNEVSFSLSSYISIIEVVWDFGDQFVSNDLNTFKGFESKHRYSKSSVYTVKATIKNKDGKTKVLSINLTLLPADSIPISKCFSDIVYNCPGDTFFLKCNNTNFKYLWNTGDTMPFCISKTSGIYSLQITDSRGCKHYQSTEVKLYKTITELGADIKVCLNDSIKLQTKGNVAYKSYKWNTLETTNSIWGYPNRTYSLSTIDMNDCRSHDTINIEPIQLPYLRLGNDTSICVNKHFELVLNANNTKYKVNGKEQISILKIDKTGQYIVEATDQNCSVQDTINVNILDYPIVKLGFDDSVCMDGSFVLDAGSAEKYQWNTGETQRYLPIYKQTLYIVKASNGNCVTKDSIFLALKNINVYIPNAFTPNNNGVNDLYKLSEGAHIKEILIYNSWGELVFESNDQNAKWDGTYMGKPCQQGVYLLVIAFWDCKIQVQYKKETIYLLR